LTSANQPDEEIGAVPNDDHASGVLLLMDNPKPMNALREALRQQGVRVDTAIDLPEARALFFSAGGHDCLVIGPDVRPGLAQQVTASLGAIDPALAVATFGPELRNSKASRTARLAGYHPGSRAGQGALLRFLRAL